MAIGPAETALLNAPHNYVNPPSNAWKVTVADSVGLVLAVLCVAIRCFTKLRITKSPGSEDGKSRAVAMSIRYADTGCVQSYAL